MDALQSVFSYKFKEKPLLIGGAAMEYYDLRKKGEDIDFVVSEKDYEELAKSHPDNVKEIFGDFGVVKDGYEVWKTIMLFGYESLKEGAEEHNGLLVASLENLLLLKALGMSEEKYLNDLRLIVKRVIENQYQGYNENEE